MLVIHIGPHKTATTTIQHFLAKNRPALEQAGWIYPVLDGGGLTYAQHDLAIRPNRFLPPESEGHGQLRALAGREGNLVLSAEAFRGWPHERFDRLADILGHETYDLVYALRDPLSVLWSYWSEEVKQGRTLSLPERFADVIVAPTKDRLLNPLLEIARYRRSPRANLRVIPFDVLAADKVDISAHFVQVALGVDPKGYVTQKPANIRFPVELTELLRAINLVRARGKKNVGSAFRLQFMEITTPKQRADMVETIRREGQAALRTVRIPERPRFLKLLQMNLKEQLAGAWTYDVTGRDIFENTRLESACYNAAVLLETPAIRKLVDEVIARVEPLVTD